MSGEATPREPSTDAADADASANSIDQAQLALEEALRAFTQQVWLRLAPATGSVCIFARPAPLCVVLVGAAANH